MTLRLTFRRCNRKRSLGFNYARYNASLVMQGGRVILMSSKHDILIRMAQNPVKCLFFVTKFLMFTFSNARKLLLFNFSFSTLRQHLSLRLHRHLVTRYCTPLNCLKCILKVMFITTVCKQ